jgi:hypothetical protein
VVDALSRLPCFETDVQCQAMSACQPKWIEEVVESYAKDVDAQEMITKLALDSNVVSNFA